MPSTSKPSLGLQQSLSYVARLRLPIFTRFILSIILAVAILCLQSTWDVRGWGSLVPDEVTPLAAHRANTYPFIHPNFTSAVLNTLALAPLLAWFEGEHGTLVCLALFFGPLSTFPGFTHVLLEKFVFGTNDAVMGSSVWILSLSAMALSRHAKAKRSLVVVAGKRVPSWAVVLLLVLAGKVLYPNTSLACGGSSAALGYACDRGLLPWLKPPEKLLKWLESKLRLSRRLPHYVPAEQRVRGRFGVLPTSSLDAEEGRAPVIELVGP